HERLPEYADLSTLVWRPVEMGETAGRADKASSREAIEGSGLVRIGGAADFHLHIDTDRSTRELILGTQTTGTSPRREDTMSDIAAASTNRGYHAHIYYDLEKTRAAAERLCAVVRGRFNVEFGGFRAEPAGPHP